MSVIFNLKNLRIMNKLVELKKEELREIDGGWIVWLLRGIGLGLTAVATWNEMDHLSEPGEPQDLVTGTTPDNVA